MVTINIEKKDLWSLGAIFIFMLGVGLVIGYGTSNPPVFGHSGEEVDVIVGGSPILLQTFVDSKVDMGVVEIVMGAVTSGLIDTPPYRVKIPCSAGYKVISGGYLYDADAACTNVIDRRFVHENRPLIDRTGWQVSTTCFSAKTYAVCRRE